MLPIMLASESLASLRIGSIVGSNSTPYTRPPTPISSDAATHSRIEVDTSPISLDLSANSSDATSKPPLIGEPCSSLLLLGIRRHGGAHHLHHLRVPAGHPLHQGAGLLGGLAAGLRVGLHDRRAQV